MALEHDDKEFERSIREKMEAHEEDVPDFAWNNISTELNRRKRKPLWLPMAIAAMVLFGSLGTWVAMNPEMMRGNDASDLAYEQESEQSTDLNQNQNEGASPLDDSNQSTQQQDTDSEEIRTGNAYENVAEASNANQGNSDDKLAAVPGSVSATSEGREKQAKQQKASNKETKVKTKPNVVDVSAISGGAVAKTITTRDLSKNTVAKLNGESIEAGATTDGGNLSDIARSSDPTNIVSKEKAQAIAGQLKEEMPTDSVIRVEEPVTDELPVLAEAVPKEIVKTPFKHIIEGFASTQYATKEAIADTDEQQVVTHQGSQVELRRIGVAVGARMVFSREKHEWYGGLSARRLTDRLKMRMTDYGDIEYFETKVGADDRSVIVNPKYRVYNATETRNFLYLGGETGYSYLAGDDNRIRLTTGLGFEFLAAQNVSYDGVPSPDAQQRFKALNQGRDFNINFQLKIGYLVPLSERYQMGIEPMVTYYLLSVGTAEYMVDLNPLTVGVNLAFRYNTIGK